MANDRRSPRVQHGPRKIISIPGTVNGVELRSQLEVSFAQELQRRGIHWQYEPERIGAGHYLVDFYLPDLRCWVEVKGRYELRDDLLLPNVAINLKRERGERLYLYMEDKAYIIGAKDYTPITLEEFWAQIDPHPQHNQEEGEA